MASIDVMLPFLAAAMALSGALLILFRRRANHGTTLIAPLYWAIGSGIALATVECLAGIAPSAGPAWLPHLRFIAACTTLCPLIAVLGAKRPQDRGWQFVVFTLLGLLVFYCLTDLAYNRPPALHLVLRWLLVIPLITMGLLNNLPTRFWPSALLSALGQAVLLSPQLPEIQALLPVWLIADAVALTGIACLFASAALWACGIPRTKRVPPSLDRVWLDFRNAFGSFWAMRVAVRFNQSSELLGWKVRLQWHGITAGDPSRPAPPIDPQVELAMRRSLESLLRRFVDPQWIERRMADHSHKDP